MKYISKKEIPLNKEKSLNSKKIQILSRNLIVTESLINKYAFIHDGKNLIKVFITREKLGFKFGEFASTRNYNKKNFKRKK